MLAELGADLGGNFEGKRMRGLFLFSLPPPRASRDDLQQLLVASRGVATLVTLDVGCW